MKKEFYFLAAVLIAGGASSIIKTNDLNRRNAELTSQNQDLQAQLQNAQSQLLKEHMKDQTEVFAAQSLVSQLQGKIAAQKEQTSIAEGRLRQEQNGGVGGKDIPGLREKLASQKQIISDLEAHLKDVRDQENGLRNQDKYYQEQAGFTQKQSDAQLKAQIDEQEASLKTMNDELKNFSRTTPIDGLYQQKLTDLKSRIAVQKSTVQQLRDQRTTTGVQWGYQKNVSHSQSKQQLDELKSQENQLQSQVQSEKQAYQSMDRDVQSGVQSQKSQAQLIQSAQNDYNSQKSKLQDLQNQLKDAQDKLSELAPPGSAAASAGQ